MILGSLDVDVAGIERRWACRRPAGCIWVYFVPLGFLRLSWPQSSEAERMRGPGWIQSVVFAAASDQACLPARARSVGEFAWRRRRPGCGGWVTPSGGSVSRFVSGRWTFAEEPGDATLAPPGPLFCALCQRRRCGALAHGFALDLDPIGVVNDAVEYGVRQGAFANGPVPQLHGQLTGNVDGLALVALLDDFQHVATALGGKFFQPQVIEDEQFDALQASEQPAVGRRGHVDRLKSPEQV